MKNVFKHILQRHFHITLTLNKFIFKYTPPSDPPPLSTYSDCYYCANSENVIVSAVDDDEEEEEEEMEGKTA